MLQCTIQQSAQSFPFLFTVIFQYIVDTDGIITDGIITVVVELFPRCHPNSCRVLSLPKNLLFLLTEMPLNSTF